MSYTNSLIVKTFPVGPFSCNCTIMGDPVSKEALVVDPGGDSALILEELNTLGLKVIRILHTHAHFDHFLASSEMRKETGAPLALHKEDEFLWNSLKEQCGFFNIPYTSTPEPDQWIEHEEELYLNEMKGKALHTPGHTPGSMSFSFEEQKVLIAGDTLFQNSIGRTDLWGGDSKQLEASIRERLYTLDEGTHVITGHGPSTTIGVEMRTNPFVSFQK